MHMPARRSEPHDNRHPQDNGPGSRDSADHGGLLSNLTLSIGSLIFRCKLEIERAGDREAVPPGVQARPVIRNGLSRALRPGTSDKPAAVRPGFQAGSHQDQNDGSHFRIPRRYDGSVAFWEALDPIEREAFRSVAFPRTFAAGAMLIREGDRADHVIVILSGRTKICTEENGTERVLAERGLGQLVGERGALQVSVRSASVIALETVQALVVRTADFAAFISAHPAVLKIVESQLYDRLTEPSDTASESAAAPAAILAEHPAHAPALAERGELYRSSSATWWDSGPGRVPTRTAALSGKRSSASRMRSCRDIPDVWSWDDRGDGLLTVVPPSVPTAKVIEHLHKDLPAALGRA